MIIDYFTFNNGLIYQHFRRIPLKFIDIDLYIDNSTSHQDVNDFIPGRPRFILMTTPISDPPEQRGEIVFYVKYETLADDIIKLTKKDSKKDAKIKVETLLTQNK